MAPIIYLVRHAESEHNVSKDLSHRDPPLTTLGITQASGLTETFPDSGSVAVVLTSPLVRTLQTTLAGFSHVLDKHCVKDGGIDKGARLIIDQDLQERSDLPCDTGSERAVLEKAFPALDFSVLGDNWFAKEGFYTTDDATVAKRARGFQEKLRDLVESLQKDEGAVAARKNIVVVTHGVFMKFLSEDKAIDLPKAGWKAFTVGNGVKGEAVLVTVD
ncbi:phosphoglycerate mutase family protein [Ilyonectria robusta]|uniref:phosphoglycerate mutase family protein n=1 Tax=Ilyonectria robusta TaxID=1079257 RepID=UPI001E8D4C8C|nr:phosphoglycerate mutase family protein [Ilyonectria robusta]KAH8661177.1 phosphoglycerate mutase family protein [Ilyonectria robusta]